MRHHDDSMADLELTRTREDRRLYALGDVGTLRLTGFWSRSATAQAGDRTWELTRSGLWRPIIRATDEAGTVVGEFEPRGGLRRGGTLRWGDRSYTLRPASSWRERYAIVDDDRELAVLDGKGWGKRPVAVTVDDRSPIDPGLLLFA
ncbi:MAG: hypothetical protein QOE98_783, partial [Gaiellaceae bacterium]|nr:hypothetical protein [Gaiellaceae bacterium]